MDGSSIRLGGRSDIGAGPGSLSGLTPMRGPAARASMCRVGARPRGTRVIVLVGVWLLLLAGAVLVAWCSRELVDLDRSDLVGVSAATWILAAGVASAMVVGTSLVWRRPEHPVGWLFVGLSLSITMAAAIDAYAALGAVAEPGRLPGAAVAAHVGDATWIPWFVLVAWILQLTPTGHPLSRRWGRVGWVATAGGLVAFAATVVSTQPVEPPFSAVANPLGFEAGAPIIDALRAVGGLLVGVGVLVAAGSMVVRFRRAAGEERLRLRWLALAAVPIVVLVPTAFVASAMQRPGLLLAVTAAFVAVIPLAAGLSISRYHLYEVDRILGRTLAYALATVAVIGVYVLAVGATTQVGTSDGAGAAGITVATLAAVAVATPVRRFAQDRIDRRFNRRRYTALRIVQRELAAPRASIDVEAVLRLAFADPTVAVAYWVETGKRWVFADGSDVAPAADALDVARGGRTIARVAYDRDTVDDATATAVVNRAAAELDNTRLRAELALELAEVSRSRSRLATAEIAVRRQVERDLHDGAQQRLLGLALDLQAARVNGDPEVMAAAVDRGIDQARASVEELRSLANGLRPAVLVDAGLSGALDELASRTPVPVVIHCPEVRVGPDIEETAWFVILEATSNALKHGSPAVIIVDVAVADGRLHFAVTDDSGGGADPLGDGLQGLRDRVEALGGDITIADVVGGTKVEGWLPCEP